MLTRADRWLVVLTLAGVVAGILLVQYWPAGTPGQEVAIEVDSEEVERFSWAALDSGEEVAITGPLGDSIADLDGEQQRVRMRYSPCPDDICVYTGWIQEPGHSIVCLPNRVIIRIEEGSRDVEEGLDGVTY